MTLSDLTRPLTSDQMLESIYAILADLGITTSTWKPGAVVRTILVVVAVVFAAFTVWSSAAIRAGFLLLSSGDWLTACAALDYGTTRMPDTFASGLVSLTLSGAGSYTWDPGDLVLSASLVVRGESVLKYYTNAATVTITSAGPPVTVTGIAVTASEIGADSTAPPGTITSLVPAITVLSVTNPAAVVGQDPETDAALTSRALLQASAGSPAGPADAYRYVSMTTLSPTTGSQIANRAKVIPGVMVTVYVAGPSGAVSGTTGDPTTDLGAIWLALQTQVVPVGITLALQSATPQSLSFSYTIYIYQTSLTDTDIHAMVTAAIATALPEVPIGGNPPYVGSTGYLYLTELRSIIDAALPQCFRVDLSLGSDVSIPAGADLIVGTITQTAVHRYSL